MTGSLAARAARHRRELSRRRFQSPDFCRIQLLFSSLVAVELIVVVIWLAPRQGPGWSLPQFAAASTMALWFGLVGAVLLCKSRPLMARLPLWLGALSSWAIPVLSVWLGSLLVQQVDVVFRLGPALLGESHWEFAGRNTAIAAVFCAALLRYLYVQEQGARTERAQARAAVDALQARIRPHFLFNSMNTIASLVRSNPETAERVVEDLSELFRAALGAGDGMSSLGEELALAQRYLGIEQLRLGERLHVRFGIAADAPLDLALPRLCLQPLVENAVHHGVARLAEGGTVSLDVEVRGDRVEVLVRNPVPLRRSPDAPGNRHALANIAQRLAYHFGDRATLESGLDQQVYWCRLSVPRKTVPTPSGRSA